ncbi:DNA-binding transcriptional LysR family regulator [Luteibacter sp. HA06]|jgi:DNA-binding transcriptional LysR family regulator
MLFDLTALRTLVTAVDLGGFGKAARHLHRTPGAVSLQLGGLEERLGKSLFQKSGRTQTLTEEGELLVSYARRLLALNDEAVQAFVASGLHGAVRFGMTQDFAEGGLTRALARFGRAHPSLRLDLRVDRSEPLANAVQAGELDLALAFRGLSGRQEPPLATMPVGWFAHSSLNLAAGEPVPLLVLDPPCGFRQSAIASLDRVGRAWRIVLSSGSVSALWAAAEAGLGVVPRTALHVPPGLKPASEAWGLPSLPPTGIYLMDQGAAAPEAAGHLANVIREVVGDLVRA